MHRMRAGRTVTGWFGLAGLLLAAACGGSGTTTDAASSSSSSGGSSSGGGDLTVTDTSATVPSDIVLSSPTASASSQSIAVRTGKAAEDPGSDNPDDYASKREALQELIAGAGECSFEPDFIGASRPNCYGPSITYNNHPEAQTKDADTVDGDVDNNPSDTDGDDTLPSGDLGIWSALEGTQACSAAQMNFLVDSVAAKVDNVVNLFGAMACAGRKAGLELPAAGETLDLSSAMSTHATISGITVSSASVARLDDDADGNAVFQSTLAISVSVGGQSQSGTLILKHVPTSADNSTYEGKLSMAISSSTFDQAGGGNCANTGAQGTTDAGTILYSKTAANAIAYELKFGQFCGGTTDPFDSNNDIDPADRVDPSFPTTNPDGWANDWHYGRFNINPENGTGSVAYAWQAGAGDGASRVFNMTTTAASDGSESGTAYFGFGPAVDDDAVGTINGFYCNWAGPDNRRTLATAAQRQVIARTASGSDFTATSSAIGYAPTNSCTSSGDDGSGNAFTFATDSGSMDNDTNTPNTAVASELIELSAIEFTLPSRPPDL